MGSFLDSIGKALPRFLRVLCIVLVSVLILQPSNALAWSEGAHYVIGLIAFDAMTPRAQKRLLEMLQAHPKFSTDFRTELMGQNAIRIWGNW